MLGRRASSAALINLRSRAAKNDDKRVPNKREIRLRWRRCGGVRVKASEPLGDGDEGRGDDSGINGGAQLIGGGRGNERVVKRLKNRRVQKR